MRSRQALKALCVEKPLLITQKDIKHSFWYRIKKLIKTNRAMVLDDENEGFLRKLSTTIPLINCANKCFFSGLLFGAKDSFLLFSPISLAFSTTMARRKVVDKNERTNTKQCAGTKLFIAWFKQKRSFRILLHRTVEISNNLFYSQCTEITSAIVRKFITKL